MEPKIMTNNEILHKIQLLILYHRRYEQFFDICDMVTKAIMIICGMFILDDSWTKINATIVICMGTLSAAFGFAERSKRHAKSMRHFQELRALIITSKDQELTEEHLAKLSLEL